MATRLAVLATLCMCLPVLLCGCSPRGEEAVVLPMTWSEVDEDLRTSPDALQVLIFRLDGHASLENTTEPLPEESVTELVPLRHRRQVLVRVGEFGPEGPWWYEHGVSKIDVLECFACHDAYSCFSCHYLPPDRLLESGYRSPFDDSDPNVKNLLRVMRRHATGESPPEQSGLPSVPVAPSQRNP